MKKSLAQQTICFPKLLINTKVPYFSLKFLLTFGLLQLLTIQSCNLYNCLQKVSVSQRDKFIKELSYNQKENVDLKIQFVNQ